MLGLSTVKQKMSLLAQFLKLLHFISIHVYLIFFSLLQEQHRPMLSPTRCGTQSPLSPLTQTTLEKHLPGLPSRRFLQQNKVQKCDVGCVTGEFVFQKKNLFSNYGFNSVLRSLTLSQRLTINLINFVTLGISHYQ